MARHNATESQGTETGVNLGGDQVNPQSLSPGTNTAAEDSSGTLPKQQVSGQAAASAALELASEVARGEGNDVPAPSKSQAVMTAVPAPSYHSASPGTSKLEGNGNICGNSGSTQECFPTGEISNPNNSCQDRVADAEEPLVHVETAVTTSAVMHEPMALSSVPAVSDASAAASSTSSTAAAAVSTVVDDTAAAIGSDHVPAQIQVPLAVAPATAAPLQGMPASTSAMTPAVPPPPPRPPPQPIPTPVPILPVTTPSTFPLTTSNRLQTSTSQLRLVSLPGFSTLSQDSTSQATGANTTGFQTSAISVPIPTVTSTVATSAVPPVATPDSVVSSSYPYSSANGTARRGSRGGRRGRGGGRRGRGRSGRGSRGGRGRRGRGRSAAAVAKIGGGQEIGGLASHAIAVSGLGAVAGANAIFGTGVDGESDGSGGVQADSLEDVRDRLQQVDTLSARVENMILVTADRTQASAAAAAAAGATAAPATPAVPARDMDLRRKRVPTARLQQHLTEVQRISRQRVVRKSESSPLPIPLPLPPPPLPTASAADQRPPNGGLIPGIAQADGTPIPGVPGGIYTTSAETLQAGGVAAAEDIEGSYTGGRKRKRPEDEAAVCGGGVDAASAALIPTVSSVDSVGSGAIPTPMGVVLEKAQTPEQQLGLPAGMITEPASSDAVTVVSIAVSATTAMTSTAAPGIASAVATHMPQEALVTEAGGPQPVLQHGSGEMGANGVIVAQCGPGTTAVAPGTTAGASGVPTPGGTATSMTGTTSDASMGSAAPAAMDEQPGGESSQGYTGAQMAATTAVEAAAKAAATAAIRATVDAQRAAADAAAAVREEANRKAAAAMEAAKVRAKRREQAKADAAKAAQEAEARRWEERVENGDGDSLYVTAMLASVVRSLAEGPKTEFELDQSVRSDMDAGRAAAGLAVADWSETHMVNVRLVVDVLIALGLVKTDHNVDSACVIGWPIDVHPPSKAHNGAPAPCFCASVIRRAVMQHTRTVAPSMGDTMPTPTMNTGDPFQLGIPWNPGSPPTSSGMTSVSSLVARPVSASPNAPLYGAPGEVAPPVVEPHGVGIGAFAPGRAPSVMAAAQGSVTGSQASEVVEVQMDEKSGHLQMEQQQQQQQQQVVDMRVQMSSGVGEGDVGGTEASLAAAAPTIGGGENIIGAMVDAGVTSPMDVEDAMPQNEIKNEIKQEMHSTPQQPDPVTAPMVAVSAAASPETWAHSQPLAQAQEPVTTQPGVVISALATTTYITSAAQATGFAGTLVGDQVADTTVTDGAKLASPEPEASPSTQADPGLTAAAPPQSVSESFRSLGASSCSTVMVTGPQVAAAPSMGVQSVPTGETVNVTAKEEGAAPLLSNTGAATAAVVNCNAQESVVQWTGTGDGMGSTVQAVEGAPRAEAAAETGTTASITGLGAETASVSEGGAEGVSVTLEAVNVGGTLSPSVVAVASHGTPAMGQGEVSVTNEASGSAASLCTSMEQHVQVQVSQPEQAQAPASVAASEAPACVVANSFPIVSSTVEHEGHGVEAPMVDGAQGNPEGFPPVGAASLQEHQKAMQLQYAGASTASDGTLPSQPAYAAAAPAADVGVVTGLSSAVGTVVETTTTAASVSACSVSTSNGTYATDGVIDLSRTPMEIVSAETVVDERGEAIIGSSTVAPMTVSTLTTAEASLIAPPVVVATQDVSNVGLTHDTAGVSVSNEVFGAVGTEHVEAPAGAQDASMTAVQQYAVAPSSGEEPAAQHEVVAAAGGAQGADVADDADGGLGSSLTSRDEKATMYACFLQDPTGVVVPVDDSFAAGAYSGCQSVATAAAGTAAMVVAAAGVRASSTATDINWEEVVALGGDPSDETKALAEEGLFDLIGDAWGPDTLNKAHAYIEEEAVEYLPLDGRAFQLAAEGRLEPGGELELTYGKAAVEMLHLWLHLKSDNWVKWREAHDRRGAEVTSATGTSTVNASADGSSVDVPATATPCVTSTVNAAPVAASVISPSPAPAHSESSSGNPTVTVASAAATAVVAGAGRTESTVSKAGGRAGGTTTGTGAGSGTGGSARSRGRGVGPDGTKPVKVLRYRLEGEQDRCLANWKEPARRVLQLELEAARLSLCEEAVLRDLLRRCKISLPPGYARAEAVQKLRTRLTAIPSRAATTAGPTAPGSAWTSVTPSLSGSTVTAAASATWPLPGAVGDSVNARAQGRALAATSPGMTPGLSRVGESCTVVGGSASAALGATGMGVAGPPLALPAPRWELERLPRRGKGSRGGRRGGRSGGRGRGKRRRREVPLEEVPSEDDPACVADSFHTSRRNYRRPRGGGGIGLDRGGFYSVADGVGFCPPPQRSFTPNLTAAEARRLATASEDEPAVVPSATTADFEAASSADSKVKAKAKIENMLGGTQGSRGVSADGARASASSMPASTTGSVSSTGEPSAAGGGALSLAASATPSDGGISMSKEGSIASSDGGSVGVQGSAGEAGALTVVVGSSSGAVNEAANSGGVVGAAAVTSGRPGSASGVLGSAGAISLTSSSGGGSRRRPEWVYLTASIRVPPPLLRGTRGAGADWGCIGGFGYGTSAGGSCGSGASSSTSSGDFFCYGPTSSRSGGKRGKSISSFSSASGSAHAGSGGVGAGEEDGPASSTPSSRRGARSHNSEIYYSPKDLERPEVAFCRGMPRPIPWSDVSRQFAPIVDPSTSHPPTSPGTRDSNRSSISPASSLPSMSATPSGSTSTTSAASSRSETSRGQESQKSVESASGGVPGAADSNAVKAGVTGGSGAGSMPEGDAAVKSTSTPVGNGVMATGAGVLLPGGLSGTAGLRISVPEENGQLASQESAAGSGANGGDDSATEGRKKGLGDRISGSGASGAPNAQEIIAPQFWLVGDQGVEGSSQVEGREGTGEGAGVQDENDSGEDTSDEAFERRHSIHLQQMREKIEQARLAREKAARNAASKKRASLPGGRSTPRTPSGSGGGGAGGGGSGSGGGGGRGSWGQGGGPKSSAGRKSGSRNKGRSTSESGSTSGSRGGRSRRGSKSSSRGASNASQRLASQQQPSSAPPTAAQAEGSSAKPPAPSTGTSAAVPMAEASGSAATGSSGAAGTDSGAAVASSSSAPGHSPTAAT